MTAAKFDELFFTRVPRLRIIRILRVRNQRSMKEPLLTFILTLTLAGGLFAIPLTVEVIKESEKIADTIRASNKEGTGLGDKATGVSPSLNEETPEWRRRIKPQHVESVESAETLAVAFNSARLAAGPRGAGEVDDTKHLSTAIACLKPQDRPFKEKDLLGNWRCRSIQASDLLVIVYPFFNCRFIRKDGKLFFEKTTGSQRRSGYLYPSAGDHMVFLGSLTMNDDVNSGEYTDTAGVLVRKGSDRFLLILDATQKGYELYEIVK